MTTNLAHLGTIKSITGITFRLSAQSHESITQVRITDQGVTVQVESYKVRDRRQDELREARFIKLFQLTPVTGTDNWQISQPITVPDPSFQPTALNKYGPGRSPSEAAERLRHERMAYRAGAGRAPMDSYRRTHQLSANTEPKMDKHWR